MAEVRTAKEKAYLYVAVDRTSKRAFAGLDRRARGFVAAAFLKVLAKAIPTGYTRCSRMTASSSPRAADTG